MQEVFRFNGIDIRAGQRRTVDLAIARLYTHTDMKMPVHVVHGKKTGPRLFVSGAIHGDEINGPEIIRRLLKLKLLSRLRGTLIAIPIINIYGYVNHSRYLPDRRDLNRSFPGSEKGSLGSHLARLFLDQIAAHCTHGIDLHSGSNHRNNLPQVRTSLDDPETAAMARAFGAPVIIDSRLRDGSLREAVREMGIPMLLYEGGEALRFNEVAIHMGMRGIVAVMRRIGMLPKREEHRPEVEPLIATRTTWVRAPISGILPWRINVGARVRKGDRVAVIADPFGELEEPVYAPVSGIVIGVLNLPMAHRGDALFNIASLSEKADVEATLEALDIFLTPEGGINIEDVP